VTRAPGIAVIEGSGDPRVPRALREVEATFERRCELVEDDDLLPAEAASPGAGLVARDLLDPLAAEAAQGTESWWLAIVTRELKPSTGPDEWAFGEALVGGGCAVVSTRRLRSSDDDLFTRRLASECVHELGHAAGLEHCTNPECVMSQARDLVELDRRPTGFCPTCAAALRALDNGRGG
jgi:archaemetzincin